MYDDLKWSLHGDQFVHPYILLMHAYCLGIRDLGYDGHESLAYLHDTFPDLIRQVRVNASNPGCSLELLEHYSAIVCAEYGGCHSKAIAAFLFERQYWTKI